MLQLGGRPRLCAITAAMPAGTGLTAFEAAYPNRTFDVGIAEAMPFPWPGALPKAGMIPVVAIYSTFPSEPYDMILQDVAMLPPPCDFCRGPGGGWWARTERPTTACLMWAFSVRCPVLQFCVPAAGRASGRCSVVCAEVQRPGCHSLPQRWRRRFLTGDGNPVPGGTGHHPDHLRHHDQP